MEAATAELGRARSAVLMVPLKKRKILLTVQKRQKFTPYLKSGLLLSLDLDLEVRLRFLSRDLDRDLERLLRR